MKKLKPKSKEYIIGVEDRKMLMDSIEYPSERLAIFGLLFTGMRVSELIHMQSDWIDWDKGIIHVPIKMPCDCYECKSHKGKCRHCKKTRPCGFWHPKTVHGARPIPLLPETRDMFKSYFMKYNSIRDTLENRIMIWRIVRTVGERAGMKVFPHCMRSTFATILVENGLEDPVAMTQIMGWADIKMAMTYIRLSGVGLKKKIDKIWPGAENG